MSKCCFQIPESYERVSFALWKAMNESPLPSTASPHRCWFCVLPVSQASPNWIQTGAMKSGMALGKVFNVSQGTLSPGAASRWYKMMGFRCSLLHRDKPEAILREKIDSLSLLSTPSYSIPKSLHFNTVHENLPSYQFYLYVFPIS